MRLRHAVVLLFPAAACASGRPVARSVAAAAAPLHRVAAVQYPIRGARTAGAVLAEAERSVVRAAEQGAELVVFPELFILDVWPERVDDEASFVRRVARETTPVVLDGLARAARARGIAVLAGSVPELRAGRLYNTAHLLFPNGREVAQDKVFPTAWGRQVGLTPGEAIQVFDAPWGRTAILICYDVEFPELSEALVETRPEVLLVPSMTESDHGFHRVRWSAQARAVEHHAYVIIAGTVGRPSPDWLHFGQAAFLTPRTDGFPGVLAEGPPNQPALVVADLDLVRLRASRAEATFYPAQDQRRRADEAAQP